MENDEWIPVMTTLSPAPEAIIQLAASADVQRNNARRIAVSAAKQGCYARTSAAVPMMNVRINNANVTMMTAILRMKRMMMR